MNRIQTFVSISLILKTVTRAVFLSTLFSTLAYAVDVEAYKNPGCGCCTLWATHLEEHGFKVNMTEDTEMHARKDKLGVPQQSRSCHTAVIEGFVFEGHIPAPVIQKFLKEKPAGALGLVVPGMPVGSPGMEYGNKKMPYTIFSFDKDGTLKEFSKVE